MFKEVKINKDKFLEYIATETLPTTHKFIEGSRLNVEIVKAIINRMASMAKQYGYVVPFKITIEDAEEVKKLFIDYQNNYLK